MQAVIDKHQDFALIIRRCAQYRCPKRDTIRKQSRACVVSR